MIDVDKRLALMWYGNWQQHHQLERLQIWVAWRMPRWLVMWATLRLVSHATTGSYRDTCVPELTVMDAIKRWDT